MAHSYAYRRVDAGIMNNSDQTLKLVMPVPEFPWGQWENQVFPEQIKVIPPRTMVKFVVESASDLTGCEGTLYFEVSGPVWQNFVVYWNNPYCGSNTYRQVLQGKSSLVTSNGDKEDDDLAWVVYTFSELAESGSSTATPAAPDVQGGAVTCGTAGQISLPVGTCRLAIPGWTVQHSVEDDGCGMDRYRSQTCDLRQGVSTIFFPSSLAATPKPELATNVLVYYCAEFSADELPWHAARFAADEAQWILVSVHGGLNKDDLDPAAMVTAAKICEALEQHGYKKSIDRLRLACHSRSSYNLVENLRAKNLVADGASPPVFDMSKLERVVSFDSDRNCDLHGKLEGILTKNRMGIVFGFHATLSYPFDPDHPTQNPDGPRRGQKEGWSFPAERTIQLGAGYSKAVKDLKTSVEGLVLLRRLDEVRRKGGTISDVATKLLDGWGEKGDVVPEQALARGAQLPPLGQLNSANIREYCRSKQSALHAAAASQEVHAEARAAGGDYVHRDFAAEFFAEAMTESTPTIEY